MTDPALGGGGAVAPKQHVARRGFLLVSAAAAAVALVCLAGFAAFLFSLDRSERDPGTATDGIVALTGGAQRIGDAIDLLAKGFAGRLLITGVNERTSRDEIARLNPRQRRLVECCVDLDYRARNTIGNAVETRRWAERNGFRSLIVVTSNYHMPRTLAELNHVLPEIRKVPYAVVTPALDASLWWRDLATARLLFAEYAKYVAVLARTRLGGGSWPEQGVAPSTSPAYENGPEPVRLVAKRGSPR
jgi:uncharacterized SAM-binding protein YcdF (DUF218 family)